MLHILQLHETIIDWTVRKDSELNVAGQVAEAINYWTHCIPYCMISSYTERALSFIENDRQTWTLPSATHTTSKVGCPICSYSIDSAFFCYDFPHDIYDFLLLRNGLEIRYNSNKGLRVCNNYKLTSSLVDKNVIKLPPWPRCPETPWTTTDGFK